LTQSLLKSHGLAVARETHEVVRDASEIISRGQRRIRKLLRRLDRIQEGSEASSVPDRRSRILKVAIVRRLVLGTGNLEGGGNGKG
jgi:hypothetical protein